MTVPYPTHTVVRISQHWRTELAVLAELMSCNVPEGGRPVTLGEAAQLAIAEALASRREPVVDDLSAPP